MARFPTANFGSAQSPDVAAGGAVVSDGYARLSQVTDKLSDTLFDMAASAAKREGAASAAKMIARQNAGPDELFAANAKYAKKQDSYQTKLSPEQEQKFRGWVADAAVPFNPEDAKSDYDMRGYWLDVASKGSDERAVNADDHRPHYPDTYKTPYHRSFSGESRYAAAGAPTWADDHRLVDPASGETLFDERGVQLRNDGTARGEGNDQVASRYLVSQSKAQMSEAMAQVYTANPDNPAELSKGLEATRQAFKPTGNPEVDAEIAGSWAILRSDYMARAFAGQQKALDAQGKANFLQDYQTSQETLDQVAAGATYDDQGTTRIKDATASMVHTLSRYGPKEAFEVAGVKFAPDPTRAGSVTPIELEQAVQKGTAQSLKTWVQSTADTLTTPAMREGFAKEVLQRWKDGDPAFRGLDGADMEQLQAKLHASADRLHTDIRQAQAEAGAHARDQIEAFQWGEPVDLAETERLAIASGDAGLVAQTRFYREAGQEMRGVMRTVVARQRGLLGNGAPGDQPVDASGNPVGAADPAALAGEIRADPQGFFSRILGKPVTITSGARSAAHNAAVGGSPTSEHLTGSAWDLQVPGMSTAEVVAALRQSGVPFDQVLDEHSHVHFGLGPAMRGQVMIKDGNTWTTPPGVKPGTPAYMAWASAREGFTSDPLNYARGGANRPAIANVPVLVPDGAFSQDPAVAGGWAAALKQRAALGQTLSRNYGVPPRLLTNGERDYYKAKIAADPMQGIALAQATRAAAGPAAAMGLLREIGESDGEAASSVHIAELAAAGNGAFARRAAQGLQLKSMEKATLAEPDAKALNAAAANVRGAGPPLSLGTARIVAEAAMIADQAAGRSGDAPQDYLAQALGRTSANGRTFGGPARMNGGVVMAPRWLAPDSVRGAVLALGDLWKARGVGPAWSNGVMASGPELAAHTRLALQPNGKYRFVDARTGGALVTHDGRPFELDLDASRAFLGARLGPSAVMGPG